MEERCSRCQEKIRKRQAFVRDGCNSRLDAIAGKIDPFQKVRDLISPNTQRDFQHFQTADLLAKRCIETRAALFDISEVERCSVGDDLNVTGVPEIGIGPGDGGAVGDGNGLRKCGGKVRVCPAAIADEPAGVDVEVHEVGEAQTLRPRYRRCLAARQGSKLIEIDRIRSLGFQVRV